MKILPVVVASFLAGRQSRSNLGALLRLLLLLSAIIVVYSVMFHYLMAREGQDHSWLTGLYWTIVAMSTLGFGDVTFHSDVGRMFSVVVVLSGMIYMLVLLPFTFIQFFYAPWLEARNAARAPRQLPATMRGHVLMTSYGPIEGALIKRLQQFDTPYAVLVADLAEALSLVDDGIPVMVGDLDDPATYQNARADAAALVVTTLADTANTNVAATCREVSERVPIVATAASTASVDILEFAGCQRVLQMGQLLGQFMARRVFGRDGRCHVISESSGLAIGEAAVPDMLVGKTIRQAGLRERFGLTVGGTWTRGAYMPSTPDLPLTAQTLLLLAGTRAQFETYDAEFGLTNTLPAFVLIIGGGRVGRAAARALQDRGIEYRMVERRADRVPDTPHVVIGDAANLAVLKDAGIDRATSVLVTTHEDDINVYLTLYCRRLKPDMLILSRATRERNTSTLHRAGADFVVSYATIGAHAIFDVLRNRKLILLAEGLDIFHVPTPQALAGRTIGESRIRPDTGCNLLAFAQRGTTTVNPGVDVRLPADGELILLGDRGAEERFFARYPPGD